MRGHARLSISAGLLFSICSFPVQAQDGAGIEIGITAGTFIYQGDLTPSPFGSYRTASYAFGLSFTRRFSGTVALRVDLHTGKLRGDDAEYAYPEWRRYRSFSFETPIQEGALFLVVSPFGNDGSFTPYVVAGAGLALLDIKRDHSKFDHAYFPGSVIDGLQNDLEKEAPRKLPVLPSGLGMKYQLNPNWAVNMEVKYRIMFTDHLDGFSLSAEPDMNDHYITYSLGLNYCLGKGEAGRCPTFD